MKVAAKIPTFMGSGESCQLTAIRVATKLPPLPGVYKTPAWQWQWQ